MAGSRWSMVLVAGFAGLTAFVVGRTTAPPMASATGSSRDSISQGALRQLSAAMRKQTREATALRDLQTIMGTVCHQLALYRIQHKDRFPTFSDMREWVAMLQKTDANGRVDASGDYGPYLSKAPANPLTGLTKIIAEGQDTKGAGWSYDETTGELRPVMPAH